MKLKEIKSVEFLEHESLRFVCGGIHMGNSGIMDSETKDSISHDSNKTDNKKAKKQEKRDKKWGDQHSNSTDTVKNDIF